ncbi:hypothetical protein M885DRAFT_73194 [Pelagophyceae sp. CCMP2097]|nr:hypothetical protein M885DRAFT_73194 [Pelagophyceae sp. CCMP2097]
MPTFQGQAISQLLWALATAGFYSPTVFEKAAKRALNQSSLFTPTAVAKTVWAFATARVPATDLFEAFTQDALRKMKGVNAKDLATTAWAYASASVEAPALFEAIASEATRRSNLLQASECATLVWACAEAGVTKPAFYDAVATPLSLHLATLTSKEVANIVWAYSKAGCRANALFESAALTLDASELDTVALSRTAWAYATARFPAPELLEAISVDVAARADFSPAMLAEVAWAFAVLGAAGPQVEKALENIADSATRPRFTQTEVATLAWSFATLGVVPHGLFDCLAKQLAFDDVEDTDLVKLQVASLFLLQAAPGHALTALLAQHEDSLRRAALAEVRFGERSRKQLSRLLVKLGWAHEASFFTDEGLRIDFAHESRHGKVALGFANVDDYLVGAGAERVLDGPAKCKDALLQASGWHVVRLPFYEWNPLETFDAKEAYLRGKVDIPEKAV